MEKSSRSKLSLGLWVAAIVFAAGLAAYAVLAARFGISSLTAAYDENLLKSGEIATFDVAKVQELRRVRAQ